MFVDPGPVTAVLDRLTSPVLLLWGSDDHLVDPPSLRRHGARAGWTAHELAGVGHLLPVEVPQDHARATGEWWASVAP